MMLGVSFRLTGRYRALLLTDITISVFPYMYFVSQANSEAFQDLLDKCVVAVPVFHAYAHNASCQHQFSPRNIEGFGLTDGENVERLWSYLGRFARMTKEMSSGNRVDLLTDALSHYCKQKQRKLGEYSNLLVILTYMYIHAFYTELTCIERFTRANKQLRLVEKETRDILQKLYISEEQFLALLPQIVSDEEARLSQERCQLSTGIWKNHMCFNHNTVCTHVFTSLTL